MLEARACPIPPLPDVQACVWGPGSIVIGAVGPPQLPVIRLVRALGRPSGRWQACQQHSLLYLL